MIDYDDLCRRVDKINKDMIELLAIKMKKLNDLKDNKTNKSCGICKWFSLKDSIIGCHLGHHIHKAKDGCKTAERREMRKDDNWDCEDWQERCKKKKRVWTCLNCGKDIYFIEQNEFYKYYHVDSKIATCAMSDKDNFEFCANPKPDSERWIEE